MGLLFTVLLLIIALIFLIFYLITIYNRLQKLRNGAEATLSQVRVAMKKRLDMIEQLVDSLKSYAHFEKNVLENITSMRSSLSNAKPDDLREIEGRSRGIVRNILAVAEDYPS